MSKAMTTEKLKKLEEKRIKEIQKWEKQKAKPKLNFYFAYLIFIITLIYITDEVASQIGTLMKTEIANDLFSKYGESSVSHLDMLSLIVMIPSSVLGLLYKPLSDKWGRKKFLIVNTFGMSFALLIIFISNNVALYFVGACIVQFFIPHDMHVVYIMESAPSKFRARMYSVIKFFANISVMLIPLLRRLLMQSDSEWRNVYLIPAIVGLVVSFIALITARETDVFIESRLRYLKMTQAEREAEKASKAVENAQGGLIPALKFAMSHKQLRWLYITSALVNIGFYVTVNYQVILSYGYAENFVANGMFASLGDEVMNFVSNGVVTNALFMFPVGCAVSQVLMGFISDAKGRKTAAIVTAVNCTLAFIGFTLGSRMGLNPYLVGFLCGACIGSSYSTNDVLIMMIGESSPTNLRSSTMSAQYIVTAVGFVISYGVGLPLGMILGNSAIGAICFGLLVPGYIAAFFALAKKTNETKGVDMDTVTGCEWD